LKSFYSQNDVNNTTDGKNESNPFLSATKNNAIKRKSPAVINNHFTNELSIDTNNSFYSWNLFNESRSYRFKDLKSPNLQFLSPDKNYRNTVNLNLASSNRDFLNKTNVGFFQNQTHNLGKNLFNLYLGSGQN
jgi:hypothetical protein